MTGNYHYSYLRRGARGTEIERFVCRVEVLEVKGDRTKVRLLQFHADGRKPGTEMRVKSSNVKVDGVIAAPRDTGPRRLPYADD